MLKLYLLSDEEANLIIGALGAAKVLAREKNEPSIKRKCESLAETLEEIKEGPGDWVQQALNDFPTKRKAPVNASVYLYYYNEDEIDAWLAKHMGGAPKGGE